MQTVWDSIQYDDGRLSFEVAISEYNEAVLDLIASVVVGILPFQTQF